jgi:hypothetical protein
LPHHAAGAVVLPGHLRVRLVLRLLLPPNRPLPLRLGLLRKVRLDDPALVGQDRGMLPGGTQERTCEAWDALDPKMLQQDTPCTNQWEPGGHEVPLPDPRWLRLRRPRNNAARHAAHDQQDAARWNDNE